ncbi:hypothetical protein [Denitratisoma oestradiolicum]|uniref:Uncharacterized protein n=1 Tax=Denitratisoma oestradiolicum TaxID=311182 RepID=A0A6S6Y115_9PROT|nr:hypothetical protein [Denitratisoma oestradiolicum]TWO80707.1 hypothetical protein CBW56_08030 [Denitratisoma oestradiolicum]CAB1370993.1 conserved membrane protein of unknown function [Denitratisoma oestradiolicum]
MNPFVSSHSWRFFRAGGFDQVRLDSGADLLAIGDLDQKLWVALSCPTRGIAFDEETLRLIDSDGDGHIRAPELIAAVAWAGQRLSRTEVLGQDLPGVPLDAIREEADSALYQAARAIVADLGRPEDQPIGVEEIAAAETRWLEAAEGAWREAAVSSPLGEATAVAHEALEAVRGKIDDYFLRCRLAAFDDCAGAALNADEATYRTLSAPPLLAADTLAGLPLARIEAGRALPLDIGLNPAWAEPVKTLNQMLLTPLLGALDGLSEAQWTAAKEALAPYGQWLAARPGEVGVAASALADLERLARYVRDLMPLANNFVAFRDFYTRRGKAVFQCGTLYLDGRAAELCVTVADPVRHGALATLSRMCLVYCDCVRRGEAGEEKTTIAAAFTAGDADQLLAGRNGVFYDRKGRDWDATITRIVDHPISLRQAFWSPYRRLSRFISEQVQKMAASRAGAAEARMAAAALEMGQRAASPQAAPAAPSPPFDVGKFAGIFAAIGLAVGALGTAIAATVTGLLNLKAWQWPFALMALLLIVSGPAMVIAWFKLRSRNLGPLLDANGWAVNARARINIPFGTSLTGLAQLPPGAERALTDPYADKSAPWWLYPLLLLVAVGCLYAIAELVT